jgi:hypothetical protein
MTRYFTVGAPVQAILSHPLALVKLGMFLRDVHRERMRQSKAAILIGPADADGNCLIVAVAKEHDPDADTDEARLTPVTPGSCWSCYIIPAGMVPSPVSSLSLSLNLPMPSLVYFGRKNQLQ